MKESTPDDIAALCSHVNVDRSRYQVFSREGTDVQRALGALARQSPAGEPVESDVFSKTRPQSKTGTSGSRLVPPLRPHSGARQALRNLWQTTDERNVLGRAATALDRAKYQSVSVLQAASGTGATTILATLARLFSHHQERVLIVVDGNTESILPFYFGMKSALYTRQSYMASQNPHDSPVYIFAADLSHCDSETDSKPELTTLQKEVDRTLFDMPPKAAAATFQEFCTSGICLVVAVPDLRSVLGIQKLGRYLNQVMPFMRPVYILNKFDPAQPLHMEIHDWLANRSRDQHVITLRRTDEANEALAEGVTVIDYAPGSGLAEDYFLLGETVRELTEIQPAMTTAFKG